MSMSNTEKTIKDIRRKTHRKHSTEEKIRIVLEGLRGEMSIAELCRRYGYQWRRRGKTPHHDVTGHVGST